MNALLLLHDVQKIAAKLAHKEIGRAELLFQIETS